MTKDSGPRHKAARSATLRAAATLIVTAALGATIANHAAAAPEHSLAGIRVFSSSNAVLRKFGSPDEVRVGQYTTGAAGVAVPGGAGGSAGGYPGSQSGGGYPGSQSGGGYPGASGSQSGGGYPGSPSSGGEDGSPGALPGLSSTPGEFGGGSSSGGGYPGASGGGYPGGSSSQSGMAIAQKSSVTWIYDRPDGGSLEFTMSSDGRVVQIHASGFKGAIRTDKGVTLGMKLSQVNDKYGFPETQFITGKILTESYTERSHAAFQFYNNRLVGIIVAAVE